MKQCPGNSFGNPLTQECVYNVLGVSTCPNGYFAEVFSKMCVQRCSLLLNQYAEPTSKYCKDICISPQIADNSTMKCVDKCPSYPSYFDNSNGLCVKFCPNNTYADSYSRKCVLNCSNGTFGDSSTWRCINLCLNEPFTVRDPITMKCVTNCSSGYYKDNINK